MSEMPAREVWHCGNSGRFAVGGRWRETIWMKVGSWVGLVWLLRFFLSSQCVPVEGTQVMALSEKWVTNSMHGGAKHGDSIVVQTPPGSLPGGPGHPIHALEHQNLSIIVGFSQFA